MRANYKEKKQKKKLFTSRCLLNTSDGNAESE